MRCSSCSKENPQGSQFCESCGSRLAPVCPACGAEISQDARFCKACGQELDRPPPAARTPTPAPALPASFASGRYQVQRFIGEGGSKRVYLGHDSKLESDVAVAVIKTEGLDAEGLTRVRREAQAMGRLRDHPNIVTVLDIGDDDGQHYIIQEFLEGGTLADVLQQAEEHRLPLDQALRIADQVCHALEHAHGRGIIHRDLKPGNVWLTSDGIAKLGDFGLAVAIDRSRVTQAGMMMGTVAYMPPEFAVGGGREADARSDLYSLGAMLYEMVAGRPPFLGDDAVSVISQHINTAPVAPSWHNEEVPRALEALIMRLLAKAPEERPESAAAVREALSAVSATASTVAAKVVQEDANPLDRLAGGVFVGREAQMDELRAGLEDALSGRGRLMMLVGEPGIGKTRTADEFATYARLRNAQVLWGRCYEGEGAPVYWPWVQLVRSYVHDRDPETLMSEMGPGAADIAQVVSEVRERLPGLPEPPELEPEQARFRLFDSITTFLKNVAKRQPIVLVLDDLHWADKPSLLLLQFLARELRGARLLVLATYRDVELRRQHPLSQTLGELNREQLSHRILLRGLTEQDVARFIEITADIDPPDALVTAVYRETEGNPFFVNEIVRLLVADGRLERPAEVESWSVTIPQGVREVVGRRLDHLSDECNQVLTIASVVGREFGSDALETVSDLSGDRLLEALEEAVAARVVNELPRAPGRYTFSHALIRETLYEELSTTRRLRLHRQVGQALEELYGSNPEQHLAELAHHFSEAAHGGDVDKAIDYATRAGDRAVDLLAYEEGASHYEVALQALDLKDGADDRHRYDLLMALGRAYTRADVPEKSLAALERAVQFAERLADPQLQGEAAFAYAYAVGRGPLAGSGAAVPALERALEAVATEESALGVRLLAALSGHLGGPGAQEQRGLTADAALKERYALARQAKEMAERVDDPEALAIALGAVHGRLRLLGPERAEECLAVTNEWVEAAERTGEPLRVLAAHASRLDDLAELGEMAELHRELQQVMALADEMREPFFAGFAPTWSAMRATMEGRYEEAERMASEAWPIAVRTRNPSYFAALNGQFFEIRWGQGRLEEIEQAAVSSVERLPNQPGYKAALPLLYLETGQPGQAQEWFERVAENDFADVPEDGAFSSTMLWSAHAARRLQDKRRAALLYERLRPYAARQLVFGNTWLCLGSASRPLGMLAATMGHWEDAERHFEEALAFDEKIGARPYLARTQYEYADMLHERDARGDEEKTQRLVNQALATFEELGMPKDVERALALKMELQGLSSTDFKTSIDAVAATVQADQPDLRPHAAPDGTVTLLFTDIVGSTPLNERLGDQRWMELLKEHNTIVREHVSAHQGYEVKTEGDGFMLAFSSARRAAECAIAIQRAFAERNETAEEKIEVRAGLHTGEAIQDDGDFYGKHVNLAARIASQATGGQILVSSLLKELTDSGGDIEFDGGTEVELKGLTGTQRVFAIGW